MNWTRITKLSSEEWQLQRARHFDALYPFTSSFRARRKKGESHPIYDFLFTYYTYSSTKIEQWHPGFGVTLEGDDAALAEFLQNPRYERSTHGVTLMADSIRPRDIKHLVWIRSLCRAILDREPRFSCRGLHEWAMVYRAPELRHDYPLRLSEDDLAAFLDNTSFCCSHFDAFRFFTPGAVRLNVLQPTAEGRLLNEQGGCLHANMDLYKWAFKLSPLISSELLRDCFFLAFDAREIDMRASPYDFSALGFAPIKIETAEGQAEYRTAQQAIAVRARILRQSMHDAADYILSCVTNSQIVSAGEFEQLGANER